MVDGAERVFGPSDVHRFVHIQTDDPGGDALAIIDRDGDEHLIFRGPCHHVARELPAWAGTLEASWQPAPACAAPSVPELELAVVQSDVDAALAAHLGGYALELTRCHRSAVLAGEALEQRANLVMRMRRGAVRRVRVKLGTGSPDVDHCLAELLEHVRWEGETGGVRVEVRFPTSYYDE